MQFPLLFHNIVSALSITSKVFQSKDGTGGDFEKSLKTVPLVPIDYKSSLVPYAYHSFIFFLNSGT